MAHGNGEGVGCLLLGETNRMRAFAERLAIWNVDAVIAPRGENLYLSAQEGLRAARRDGKACIAAEGEMWAAALSLAAQLSVERIALIAPTDRKHANQDPFERQMERMKGFARRNLSFCVSEILMLEDETDFRSMRRMDAICRRLQNSRVYRVMMGDQRWTNCEQSPLDVAARFISGREFEFSLAK